jgi:hypothetical protein
VGQLLGAGLNLLANAALVKGKDWLKEKTGIDVDKDALSETDKVALRKFEMEHEEELLKLRLEENKLDAEITQMYLADIAGAREREVRIAESPHASWLNRNMGPIIGLVAIMLTFGLFYKVLFDGQFLTNLGPNRDVLLYILGVLSAVVTQIFSYYFGSSSGSKAKSEDLARVMEGLKKGGQS